MTQAAPICRVWLVVNAGSGSTDDTVAKGLKAKLAEVGIALAGETDFPGDAAPTPAQLDAVSADTLLICGGDGTINAAWCAADQWGGQCLVLPGGTMNGLAKALHGDADRDAIFAAAGAARLVYPPIASAGGFHAMVGVILGPAASWVHAREGVRKGRFARAVRAARLAWSRTFSRSVRVAGQPGGHRAVIVTPVAAGLEVATVSAAGITDALRLGWDWIRGDWRAGPGVTVTTVPEVTLIARRTVRALFDGEPQMLDSPAKVSAGHTRLAFVATA